MFLIYSILVHVAFFLVLPMLLVHPKLRDGFWARLGFVSRKWTKDRGRPTIWMHGASAGDLASLQPVILELRNREPDVFIVVTTITNSGMTMARDHLRGADRVGYLPYDLPWAVSRVVKAIRPDVLVLEYAEVWPALIRLVNRFGAKIVLTNGRFNERSLNHYRWFYRLIGNPLHLIDLLCMRSEIEAQHARAIGAPAERVRICGNTKFDSCRQKAPISDEELQVLADSLGIEKNKKVIVLGSTHDGEEGPLLDVFNELKAVDPDLYLVIAPRYLERVDRIVALAKERGLDCGLRSVGSKGKAIVILDSVGELAHVYRLATIVFVGGSFVNRGGQNILEPAACGKPVLFGPHMENFRYPVQVLLGRGGIQVPNIEAFQNVISKMLSKPQELNKLGKMAKQAVEQVQGASLLCAQAISELWDQNQDRLIKG
jgi:3-deoxy-D-manno-octulosonic-acid transferase